jgi:hypothetical protein
MGHASFESGRRLRPRDYCLVAVTATAGISIYLAAAAVMYRLGFPLDDSWIHATYARNLAVSREWAFQLGQRSAGSTAPFWTLLLVPGYWLGMAPLWWSHFLGLVTLIGLALVAEVTTRCLDRSYRPPIPWVGLFVALEWHMLWAAASGMETLFHATLATIVLAMIMTGSRKYVVLGLLTGLSVWVRPDGVTLVGPVLLGLVATTSSRASRFRALISYVVGFGAVFLPYLVFNLWLSGTPMPNTFYAKQAEYTAWQARSPLYRMGIGIMQVSTGPFVLLWPALVMSVFRIVRAKNIAMGAALAWCGLYILMYVLRLPAYQHGRYLMPAMPTLVLFSMLGFLDFQRSNGHGRARWAIRWAWQSGLALLTLGFLLLGARAYGKDVALIENEMVDTARWIQKQIPPDAIIAAHDIGALGYFDNHSLIDLAGLVSPQVLPFIRNEARLAEFLDQSGAQYLVAFPVLYPELVAVSRPIYSSGGKFAGGEGQGNMTVYCWRCR